jgi:hypothetical protein
VRRLAIRLVQSTECSTDLLRYPSHTFRLAFRSQVACCGAVAPTCGDLSRVDGLPPPGSRKSSCRLPLRHDKGLALVVYLLANLLTY